MSRSEPSGTEQHLSKCFWLRLALAELAQDREVALRAIGHRATPLEVFFWLRLALAVLLLFFLFLFLLLLPEPLDIRVMSSFNTFDTRECVPPVE
jgi:hypothetical protein